MAKENNNIYNNFLTDLERVLEYLKGSLEKGIKENGFWNVNR